MLALYRIFFFTCCIKISKIHVVYVSVSVGREDCSDCSRGHFNICKQISTFPIIHINEKLGTVTSRSFPVPSHVVFIVSKPIQTVCTLLSQHEIELNDRTVKFRHPLIFIWFAEMNSASISSGNQLWMFHPFLILVQVFLVAGTLSKLPQNSVNYLIPVDLDTGFLKLVCLSGEKYLWLAHSPALQSSAEHVGLSAWQCMD